MKKRSFILFFIIFYVGFLTVKIYSSQLKNINIKVDDCELAIILIHLNHSDSVLLKTKEDYALYVFNFENESNLEDSISPFTKQLDYVFTKEEYPLSYPHKILLDSLMIVGDMNLEKNRLHYHDYTFCINETSNCDFVYLTEEISVSDSVETLFYSDTLSSSYIDTLHEEWIDFYKVTKDSYTILMLSDDYEIIHLHR